MSRKCSDWVWNQPIKPAAMKLTLLAMADRANEDHECWPSYERLENDTGLNRKTISKYLMKLMENGCLTDSGKRKGKTGRTVVYKFTFISLKEVKNKPNRPKNGTISNRPKSGTIKPPNRPKNGTINRPKNGTIKSSQKRYAEPPSLLNHPIEPPNIAAKQKKTTTKKPKSTATWLAYEKAYHRRYGVAPLRNAKVSKQLCMLVDQVGAENAPLVAAYYLTIMDSWYLKKSHDVSTLLQNAQAIFTQWATGTNKTSRDHQQQERRSTLVNSRDEAMRIIQEREKNEH